MAIQRNTTKFHKRSLLSSNWTVMTWQPRFTIAMHCMNGRRNVYFDTYLANLNTAGFREASWSMGECLGHGEISIEAAMTLHSVCHLKTLRSIFILSPATAATREATRCHQHYYGQSGGPAGDPSFRLARSVPCILYTLYSSNLYPVIQCMNVKY